MHLRAEYRCLNSRFRPSLVAIYLRFGHSLLDYEAVGPNANSFLLAESKSRARSTGRELIKRLRTLKELERGAF